MNVYTPYSTALKLVRYSSSKHRSKYIYGASCANVQKKRLPESRKRSREIIGMSINLKKIKIVNSLLSVTIWIDDELSMIVISKHFLNSVLCSRNYVFNVS